jgi:DNA repair exonuclease SbcCD ATPase subunit
VDGFAGHGGHIPYQKVRYVVRRLFQAGLRTPMPPKNVSAEYQALWQALQCAESEVAQAKSAQKRAEDEATHAHAARHRAEAKLMEVSADLNTEHAKARGPVDASHPEIVNARAAQKHAETRIQVLEAQLRGQHLELEPLQMRATELEAEVNHLRALNRAQHKALQNELEKAQAELEQLRIALEETVASHGSQAPQGGGLGRPTPMPPPNKASYRRVA